MNKNNDIIIHIMNFYLKNIFLSENRENGDGEKMTNQEKYMYISFSHKDKAEVLPVIELLQSTGFHVWYGDGDESGEIQEKLENSEAILIFMSNHFLKSLVCRKVLNFALANQKSMVVVHLEETEMLYDAKLQLVEIQHFFMFRYTTTSDFIEELGKSRALQICRDKYQAPVMTENLAMQEIIESDMETDDDIEEEREKVSVPEKYIYISFAHDDGEKALSLIQDMKNAGFRIFYDDGSGSRKAHERLENSEVILLLLSNHFIKSSSCRKELNFALENQRSVIAAHLEDTEMVYDKKLQLIDVQHFYVHQYTTMSDFIEDVGKNKSLQICREAYQAPALKEESLSEQIVEYRSESIVEEKTPVVVAVDRALPVQEEPVKVIPAKIAPVQEVTAKSAPDLAALDPKIYNMRVTVRKSYGKEDLDYETYKNTPSEMELLRKSEYFLTTGEWGQAEALCDRVLANNPENADAYLGKLLAEMHLHRGEELKDVRYPFDSSSNYQKILRFGDAELKRKLSRILEYIHARNEYVRNAEIYNEAKNIMQSARTRADWQRAAESFALVSSFADAVELETQCLEQAELLHSKSEKPAKKKKEEKIENTESETPKKPKKKALVVSLLCLVLVGAILLSLQGFFGGNAFDTNVSDSQKPVQTMQSSAQTAQRPSQDVLMNALVGGYISFGTYEQDGNLSNGAEDIEWLVLDIQDGKALVISKYVLGARTYNGSTENVTWETCSLRGWLNNDFLNGAFTNGEKSLIFETDVSADKNPNYVTLPGNPTRDKIFLLSITEAERYFSSDSNRTADCTQRAIAQGCTGTWWLRSPGGERQRASYISIQGGVAKYGNLVGSEALGVRPAMWIDLNA